MQAVQIQIMKTNMARSGKSKREKSEGGPTLLDSPTGLASIRTKRKWTAGEWGS